MSNRRSIEHYTRQIQDDLDRIIEDKKYELVKRANLKDSHPDFDKRLEALIEWCKLPESTRGEYEGLRKALNRLYVKFPYLKNKRS
jgi:hypothetical protein